MTAQGKRILTEALALPPAERAVLADQLLSSFDHASNESVDAAWAKEAEARIDAYDRGEMLSTPVHEVFAELEHRERQ